MQESQSSTDDKGTGVVSSNVHEEPSPVGKGRYIHMYGWMIYPKETLNNKFGNNAFGWMKESASKTAYPLILYLAMICLFQMPMAKQNSYTWGRL